MKRKGQRVAGRVIRQLKADVDEREVTKAKQQLKGAIRYVGDIAKYAKRMEKTLTGMLRKANWTENDLEEAEAMTGSISDIAREWL